MKLYLSSYKLGREVNFLKNFIKDHGNSIAYIQNAVDFVNPNIEKRNNQKFVDIKNLIEVGFNVEELDLKNYFGKRSELRDKLNSFQAVWVAGGNTHILRQAMFLSGFDEILTKELVNKNNFLYSGYSAGCCILSPSLDYLQIVDDPSQFPYQGVSETIWKGLDIIDFAFLPHYDSDHPESNDINKEIQYCIDNKIFFLAFRDGEVLVED